MPLMRYILFGYVALSLFCPWEGAQARHVPEHLLQELYQEITYPACRYSNQVDGTSLDCENPDPAASNCWQKNLHRDYGQEGISKFLNEIKESNLKYQYYNDTTFNEFISNRNWDNMLYYAAIC